MPSDLHERILTGEHERELKELASRHKLPVTGPPHAADWQHAWRYRRKWLALYDGCSAFRGALAGFYEDCYVPAATHIRGRHPNGFEELRRRWALRADTPAELALYLDGMQEFCRQWGLDRLYPVEVAVRTAIARSAEERATIFDSSRPDGAEEVHAWCYKRAAGREMPFDAVRGAGGALPSVGEPQRIELPDGVTLIDATGDPLLTVEVAEPWRFLDEGWDSFEQRVLERVREQLRSQRDRVLERARSEGAVYRKARPALLRGLAWAFMHVALGLTYAELHARTPDRPNERRTPQTIAEAVSDHAPLIGLRLHRS